MKKLLGMFAVMMAFANVANAGILIEPYLGMESGKYTSGTGDGKTEFTNMGVRVAYTLPVLVWIGADATIGMSGKYKPDSGGDVDAKRTSIGAVVGVDLPILLRAWAGVGLSNEIKVDSADNVKYKGGYTKFGIGFTGLPFVSLNLELIKDDFKDFTSDLGSGDADLKNDSYMFSVSLPLEF
ncbi:MAG: hypothetical protein HUU57_06145 [Bdellovibrio sp.]|nr:hypothetical protein [Bdellovibrio sp.]